MNLLDKVILEWSFRTQKGYPDINNESDIKLFESMFGFNLLAETKLTPKELAKNNSKTGVPRIDILISKIQDEKPLKLTSGLDFLVHDPDGSVVTGLKSWQESDGKVVLSNASGDKVTTSDLAKTEDFGGGKGSGGGSAQTDLQESAQCIVNALAYRVKGKAITAQDLTRKNLIDASKYVEISSSINDTVSWIEDTGAWHESLAGTANKLLQYTGKKALTFHRGSAYVAGIYNAWRAAKKNSNLGNIKDDKWNPADIWAVDSSVADYTFATNIDQLNEQLIELFDKNLLIGISLKLTSSFNLEIKNREPKESGVDYKTYTTSAKAKDAYIDLTNGSRLQLRTFSTDGTSFQGELKGKEANQGKIGGGIINTLFVKHNLKPLPKQKQAVQSAKDLDDSFVGRFVELYSKYANSTIDKEDLESRSVDWISSKFQALSVIDVLETGNKKDIEKAINDIYNYAGSSSSISSVYLKIS